MNTPTPLPSMTLTTDCGAWGEDMIWLAQTRLAQALEHVAASSVRVHLREEGLCHRSHGCRDITCLAEVRLVGGEVVSAAAVRATPQGAIIAALRLLRWQVDPYRARCERGCIPHLQH